MYSYDFFERRFGARGIDHKGRRAGRDGSAIGTRYQHTSPEMRARVIEVIEAKLNIALATAARLLRSEGESDRS